MKSICAVLLFACAISYAEEAEKPPAPPPGWDAVPSKSIPTASQAAPEAVTKKDQPLEGDDWISRIALKQRAQKLAAPLIATVKRQLKEKQTIDWMNFLKDKLSKLEAANCPRLIPEEGHEIGAIVGARVIQIVDGMNMIVTITWDEKEGLDPNYPDEKTATLWIEGMNTEGKVDGETYDFKPQVFKYMGTKRYATAIGGTKTVYLAKTIELRDK